MHHCQHIFCPGRPQAGLTEAALQVVPVARPVKSIKARSPHKAAHLGSHGRLAKKLGLGKAHAGSQTVQQPRRAAPAQRHLKVCSLSVLGWRVLSGTAVFV